MEASKIVMKKLNIKLEDVQQNTEFEKAVRKITNTISLSQLSLMKPQDSLDDQLKSIEAKSEEDYIQWAKEEGTRLIKTLSEYIQKDYKPLPKQEQDYIKDTLREYLSILENS